MFGGSCGSTDNLSLSNVRSEVMGTGNVSLVVPLLQLEEEVLPRVSQ